MIKEQMHILIEDVVMISKYKIYNFSIGEMDLAIADYSKALEIDNKINNKVS